MTKSLEPTLDAIAVHLVETTASAAGVTYRNTAWALTVRYVVASRRNILAMHLYRLALLARQRPRGQA